MFFDKPTAKSWRMPVWVPLAFMTVAIVVFVLCFSHLGRRVKAQWPW